ncbi:class I SAM-dependent methyltransferase [Bacillus sp. N9]
MVTARPLAKKRYNVHGSRLLDLACGTGELAILLAKEGFTVTGVDLSDEMLSVARRKQITTLFRSIYFSKICVN